MYSLIDDLATLTTIPLSSLQKLNTKSAYCICNCIEETKLKGEALTDIDIGIGSLQINVVNNNINYRFIPNKKFNEAVKDTIINHKNPLIEKVDEVLVQKILRTYKDFL